VRIGATIRISGGSTNVLVGDVLGAESAAADPAAVGTMAGEAAGAVPRLVLMAGAGATSAATMMTSLAF